MENIIVEKVWLTDTEVWIRTTDGKEACEKFSDFQRLKWATPAHAQISQRAMTEYIGESLMKI